MTDYAELVTTLLKGGLPEQYASVVGDALRGSLARARDSALEEAAKACEAQQATFGSNEYALGQPLSSFSERFACGACAEAIRSLKTSAAE